MIPWEELDRANVPGQAGDIILLLRGAEFSIRTSGTELMSSSRHGSEEFLAETTCRRIRQTSGQKILIGGLGMGYTLAAALACSGPDAAITVSELIPAVIEWNRKHLGHLAGRPLSDPRVFIENEDVVKTIKRGISTWHAILLDVDNGPDGLTRKANDRLYDTEGLSACFSALRPGGILSVWSSGADADFTRRLNRCGFRTETTTVRARKPGKGSRHTIWVAEKP